MAWGQWRKRWEGRIPKGHKETSGMTDMSMFLWWWFHGCTHTSKLLKLRTLQCAVNCMSNYPSVKPFKRWHVSDYPSLFWHPLKDLKSFLIKIWGFFVRWIPRYTIISVAILTYRSSYFPFPYIGHVWLHSKLPGNSVSKRTWPLVTLGLVSGSAQQELLHMKSVGWQWFGGFRMV